MSVSIRIEYFTDALCVWAYLSQVRIDELRRSFGDAVEVECRYFQVFGDIDGWLDRRWRERGGVAGYAEHVRGVAEQFRHVPVHPEAWVVNTPKSSMPSHLFLCAVRLWEAERRAAGDPAGDDALQRAAWAVRKAHFQERVDVSRRAALLAMAEELGFPVPTLESCLDDGRAHAALSADLELAREHGIRSSPTLIFNEGRQRLVGNVGYRIIEANVRELLERPADRQSWC